MENIFSVDFNYSMKDIPISNKKEYLIKLYDSTSKFINRLRWKFFFCNRDDTEDYHTNNDNIFKSSKAAPACEELRPFEKDLLEMINSIKFDNYISNFHKKMKNDIRKLLEPNKIIIFADKTRNLYKATPKFYKQLITNSITKTYKTTNEDLSKIINSDSEKLIDKKRFKNRKIPKYTESEAFITVKDHKNNFPLNIECRLINPGKNHIGKISKEILENIVNEIRSQTNLKQWKNSSEVIKWFNTIECKTNKCFITFDIEKFYPSIKREHLVKAIKFARIYTTITENDMKIIEHTCISILTHENRNWIKSEDSLFDVPMGSFFGAELCDLIGLYILKHLQPLYDKHEIGLYRDDGLAIINKCSNSMLDNLRKKTIATLKKLGFKITIETGLVKCNFLDITLDMARNIYKPYRKENMCIRYIDKKSNHPSIIKKNLPIMIEKRINTLSKNKEIFEESVANYQQALNNSNFNYILKFSEKCNNEKKNRPRKRKTIYYNPPFCLSVKTNLGKKFLQLIGKHFTEDNGMKKLFNRNNCKLSYSCMSNIKSLIQRHNRRVLNAYNNRPKEKNTVTCNCRKNKCPLDHKCLTENVIYEAKIRSKNEEKRYIGSTGGIFKSRWYNHMSDIRNSNNTGTELSKYIWNLKEKNITFSINWKILHKIGRNKIAKDICNTCNLEKYEIAMANKRTLLNKRNDLFSNCPHFRKLYFKT